MRLKIEILKYVENKDKVRLRDLIGWLNERGKIYGTRKVAGNLATLGWRQVSRKDDVYRRVENEKGITLHD
jgi:repressor of nif and glnA expression